MDILIFKTDINSKADFLRIRKELFNTYNLKECTVDLEDKDRILRVVGNNLKIPDITLSVNTIGFTCKELQD